MRNEPFDNALRGYCQKTGVSEKSVFIICYEELSKALTDYKDWLKNGTASPRVITFLKEMDKK